MLKGKKILFICAHFFDYEKNIAAALKKLGAEVYLYDERPSNTVFHRGIIRVNPKILEKKIHQYYQKILEDIQEVDLDFFLLVKGEAIPDFFLENIKILKPKITCLLYTFDSIEEHPKILDIKKYFHHTFTFDRVDAIRYRLHFRPLFFVDDYGKNMNFDHKKIYDISFIGSAHTDRYFVGESIRILAEELQLSTYFYYYAPSKSAFWLKRIFDKNFKKFDSKKLSFQKLTHQQIIDIYSKSDVILDINKPFQNGLTMRTFESLAMGKKLITTNQDIIYYPFYDENRILVIDRENLLLAPEFFKTTAKKIAQDELAAYTLSSWISDVFSKI